MELIGSRKWLIFSGGGIIFVILYLYLFMFPTLNRLSFLKEEIPQKEKEIEEMQLLSQEYLRIKKEQDTYRNYSNQEKESIFSLVERIAVSKGLSKNILSMKPLSSSEEGEYEEVAVQVKMTNLSIEKFTDYLYTIENPPHGLRIKELNIKPEKERLTLEANFVVSKLKKRS